MKLLTVIAALAMMSPAVFAQNGGGPPSPSETPGGETHAQVIEPTQVTVTDGVASFEVPSATMQKAIDSGGFVLITFCYEGWPVYVEIPASSFGTEALGEAAYYPVTFDLGDPSLAIKAEADAAVVATTVINEQRTSELGCPDMCVWKGEPRLCGSTQVIEEVAAAPIVQRVREPYQWRWRRSSTSLTERLLAERCCRSRGVERVRVIAGPPVVSAGQTTPPDPDPGGCW